MERIVESRFPSDFGEFKLYAFEDSIAQELHLALVKGSIDPDKPIPVRILRPCFIANFSRSLRRAIEPSSFKISTMTAAGSNPAIRARSQPASRSS